MLLPTELTDLMAPLRFELRLPDSKSDVITNYTMKPNARIYAPSSVILSVRIELTTSCV